MTLGYAQEGKSAFFMMEECELLWSEEGLWKVLLSKEMVTISPSPHALLKCDLAIRTVVHYLT